MPLDMKIFSGRTAHWGAFRRAKVTLGTFDGVHVGHQRVLRRLTAWARETGGESVVITFDRKPRRVLDGRSSDQILSLRHRLLLFERLGVDAVIVLEFDPALASTEPEAFVMEFLVQRLHAEGVLLGHDTRFGCGARGDTILMRKLGRKFGFNVRSVPVVVVDASPVSSTRLRHTIRSGDLALAERLLGRRVSVYGTVVPGTARGRELGFPTANLDLNHEVHPPQGVYATRALLDGVWRDCVTNIGRRRSLRHEPGHPGDDIVVEVHLLNFSEEIYGKDLEVRFIKRLRSERVFKSRERLAGQIARDIAEARAVLAALEREAP